MARLLQQLLPILTLWLRSPLVLSAIALVVLLWPKRRYEQVTLVILDKAALFRVPVGVELMIQHPLSPSLIAKVQSGSGEVETNLARLQRIDLKRAAGELLIGKCDRVELKVDSQETRHGSEFAPDGSEIRIEREENGKFVIDIRRPSPNRWQ